MIKIQINELLKEHKRTKYWFIKEMGGSYTSMSNLMNNKTKGIKFDTLDKICNLFDCEIGEIITHKKGKRKK